MITLIAVFGSIATGVTLALVGGSTSRQLVGVGVARPLILLLLPAWLFVRMALNAIDGMMARELNMASTTGAILNETGDVISDLALYLPLAFVHEPSRWPLVAFTVSAVMTEFCGVLARALGATRRYDGPMGKSDRALMVGALGLAAALYPRSVVVWPWVFSLAALLGAITCWNRLSKAVSALR
jgi:phosphatidylglycerophosphate synthase